MDNPVNPEEIPQNDPRWEWFRTGWQVAVDILRENFPEIPPYAWAEPTIKAERIYETKRALEYMCNKGKNYGRN